ncbi:universal stress protein [Bacillus aerolatus]|uniref:Universal stress protein n=1 Tax=Bacillus aerolatus TaxID=2653354 RepID=A0A6I1FPJ5_9BACI|nr:universal stress protein [Bacillus aerolatus]KAB7706200.1 universal stress protein [Bacillus aerolatus]
MYKHILLAADGSDHSIRAARHAAEIARHIPDSKVDILFVIDYNQSKSDILHKDSIITIQKERSLRLKPHEEILQNAGVAYTVKVKHGEPGSAVAAYANEFGVDLVVIGSRGLNKLQEFVLGGVSHKVAKRVKCPVMIVK